MSRNPQPAFNFGPAWTCDQDFRESMRALYDAYEQAGNLVVAGATGIDKSDLSKMFEPGSGRHLRYKAVFAIGALGSLELRRRALEPLARCWGLEVCDPTPPRTPEEENTVLHSVIAGLGPIAQEAARLALQGRKAR